MTEPYVCCGCGAEAVGKTKPCKCATQCGYKRSNLRDVCVFDNEKPEYLFDPAILADQLKIVADSEERLGHIEAAEYLKTAAFVLSQVGSAKQGSGLLE